MTINIGDVLRSPGMPFDFSYTAELGGYEFEDIDTVGPASVRLVLTNLEGCIKAVGSVTVTLRLVCDICLEPYETTLELPFDESFMSTPDSEDPDEIYTYANYRLSPDKMLRDLILLNIPSQCRCPDHPVTAEE